ncbi:hypothetical protein ACVWW4_008987 [Bradyrhizobium sp. LB7.1]
MKDFEFEIDGKPIVIHSEPGETAARLKGGELSAFLNRNFCIWVQNPFLLDREFSALCFLGLIARFQANSDYGKEEVINLIDLVAEAMFSSRKVEGRAEEMMADTMELRNPVTWRTVYEGFKFKGGTYGITVELSRPVIDPYETIERNFKIRAAPSPSMPDESGIFHLIREFMSQIIETVRPNLSKAGGALKEAPRTPIVMSHMDIVSRAGVIFAESALRQLCVPWLGVESLDARRAIHAEPLIKTRIQPQVLSPIADHVRPIEFVQPATKHIFDEAMLTWHARSKERISRLLFKPALLLSVGAVAGALVLAIVLSVVDVSFRGQPVTTAPVGPPALGSPTAPAQNQVPPPKAPGK